MSGGQTCALPIAVQVGQCGKLANRIGNGARQVVGVQNPACPTSKTNTAHSMKHTRRGESMRERREYYGGKKGGWNGEEGVIRGGKGNMGLGGRRRDKNGS